MQPISVIAIGRDGVTMSTLMNQFRLYAQRSHIPSDDLKIVRSHRNGIFVEANSLLLATNGVCFIGDWSSYNASSSAYIKNGKHSTQLCVANAISFWVIFHQFWIRDELLSMHKRILNFRWSVPFGRIGFIAERERPSKMWWCFQSNFFLGSFRNITIWLDSFSACLVFLAFQSFSRKISQIRWSMRCWKQIADEMNQTTTLKMSSTSVQLTWKYFSISSDSDQLTSASRQNR